MERVWEELGEGIHNQNVLYLLKVYFRKEIERKRERTGALPLFSRWWYHFQTMI